MGEVRMINSEVGPNGLSDDPIFRLCAPFRTLHRDPLGFVDIGASGGVCDVVRPIASLVSVLGFEPDPQAFQDLQAEMKDGSPWANCQIHQLALSSDDGSAKLNRISWSQNDSLLTPNKKLVKRFDMVKWITLGSIPVRTARLDSLLFGVLRKWNHQGEFLKLDTQGTEFEILNGAIRTISERTMAILTEVEFAELYDGQKLFSDIEQFLRAHGFSFYGFTTFHLRSRKMLDKTKEIGRERIFQADAVFFKDPLLGGNYDRGLPERGNHVLFVAAMLLGYHDFALELALNTWATGKEAANIKRLIHRYASLPKKKTYSEVLSLAARIKAKPESANIEVGRFVDERRYLFDYSDVPRQ